MWRDAEAFFEFRVSFFELGDSLVLFFDMLQQHSDDTLDFIGLFAQPRFVNLDRHDADIADSGNHDKINLSPGRERLPDEGRKYKTEVFCVSPTRNKNIILKPIGYTGWPPPK